MASPGGFKDKFGLDYLKRGTPTPSQRSEANKEEVLRGMEDALLAWGRPVLEQLKKSPGESGKVFELAERLNVRLDTLFPVIEALVSKRLVVKSAEDRVGNDTLSLTVEGAKLIS